MSLWIAIGCAAVLSFVFKAAGPVALGDRELPPAARDVVALLAPVLLAGLVVVNVVGHGADWALPAGLVCVAAAWLCRAPMVLAVVIGVAVTAVLRLVA